MSIATTFRNQLARVGEFLPLTRRQLKKMNIPGSVASFVGNMTDMDLEPSTDWTGEDAITNARKMVRTDTQVRALLNALKLPILAAGVNIEPASDDARDEEIAEFVNDNFFENDNFTFQELLKHVLMYLEFGAEFMGKEFEEKDGKLRWKRFVHIKPEAILDLGIINGDLFEIEYLAGGDATGFGGERVVLTADQIFHIANEMEGSNFRGQSILRSSWRNFLIKDTLIRVDAIKHERFGSPTPVGDLDNENLRSIVEPLLKELRANAKGYIAKTKDWELKQFPESTGGRLGTDVIASIDYHDKQMTGSIVADFLTIGRSNVGSFAMNASKQDFFMMGLGAHFDLIEGIFNRGNGPMQHIRQLVDFNFGRPAKGYPRLTFVRPTLDDAKEFADTITSLMNSRSITRRAGDEQFIRQRVGMRELTPEEETEVAEEPLVGEPEETNNNLTAKLNLLAQKKSRGPNVTDEFLDFEARIVDFAAIQRKSTNVQKDVENKFKTKRQSLETELIDEAVSIARETENARDLESKIKALTLKDVDPLKEQLENRNIDMFEFGREQVDKEIDKQNGDTTEAIIKHIAKAKSAIKAQISQRVNKFVNVIKGAALESMISLFQRDERRTSVIRREIKEAVARISTNKFNETLATIQIAAFGLGRTLQTDRRGIRKVVRSEALDENTCAPCSQIDGREYEIDSAEFGEISSGNFAQCEGRGRCRGINIPVVEGNEA